MGNSEIEYIYITKDFRRMFKQIIKLNDKLYGYDLLNNSDLVIIKNINNLIKVEKDNLLFRKLISDEFRIELIDALFDNLKDKLNFSGINKRTYYNRRKLIQ